MVGGVEIIFPLFVDPEVSGFFLSPTKLGILWKV